MEKSTKIMLVVIAILASFITVLVVSPGARVAIITGTNNTILKPVMGAWLRFVNWLDGFRASYMLGGGIVCGLVVAVVINQIALPKLRGATKKVPKPYIGGPEYVPPAVLSSASPAIATNPKQTTPPVEEETTTA